MLVALSKYSIITVLFFFFMLLQGSFLPYFAIYGQVPNLIFILFFIIIFFEDKKSYQYGFFAAIAGGFFLDLFVPPYFGFSIAALLIIYFAQKLARHIIKEGQEKTPLASFVIMFLIGIGLHIGLMYLFSIWGDFVYVVGWNAIFGVIYSMFVALAGFYIYKIFFQKDEAANQLKLL